jgi:hypothetical protein
VCKRGDALSHSLFRIGRRVGTLTRHPVQRFTFVGDGDGTADRLDLLRKETVDEALVEHHDGAGCVPAARDPFSGVSRVGPATATIIAARSSVLDTSDSGWVT